MNELLLAVLFLGVTSLLYYAVAGRRLRFSISSPIYAFVGTYMIIGIVGSLYYKYNNEYVGGFYDVGASREQINQSLAGFLVAVASFLVGVIVYSIFSKRIRCVRRSKSHAWPRVKEHALQVLAFSPGFGSLAILTIPLFITIIGQGFENIIWRSEYQVEQYHYLKVAGVMLSLPAAFVLGIFTPMRKNRVWQGACVILLLVFELVFLGLSTRRIAVALLFYVLGLAFGGARRKTVWVSLSVWTILLPLMLHIPIELRRMPEQGLFPLANNLEIIMSDREFTDLYVSSADYLIKNITFGVPLAGYVKDAPPISTDILFISVNPLPSFVPVAGLRSWGSVSDELRVSKYIPYSALGELLNYGWFWLMLYYAFAGTAAAWIDVGMRIFRGRRASWGYVMAAGMIVLFSISSTQYNLRSTTRFIYYAIAVAILWQTLFRITFKPRPD